MTTLPCPYYQDSSCTLYLGDALEVLRGLPDESVHCCVTSPPYWGLRDYGVAGQIGLEKTPEDYVAKLVEVFREVRRVLREDGTLWLNMGDSYACTPVGSFNGGGLALMGRDLSAHNEGSKRDKLKASGLKPKDLCGIPWRVAFALQADGWWLRQDIIWAKPNPMPESVTDRCTKAHEYIFMLSKSARYFFDTEAIKEPQSQEALEKYNNGNWERHSRTNKGSGIGVNDTKHSTTILEGGRNKRSVWTVPSQAYPESHFATFPEDLIKPCILAGTSARGCCPKCGAPWLRVVDRGPIKGSAGVDFKDNGEGRGERSHRGGDDYAKWREEFPIKTLGWKPTCGCGCPDTIPCTVADVFAGSFTTGQVALEMGRNCIGIELSQDYMKLAIRRTNVTKGLALA